MKYRPEIDGLRALAVVPVILFHAGFPYVTGGYVGVDVFFVISGYLITTILIGELEQGKFSILGFYDRRVRRIMPSLFVVIAASFIAGLFILLPADFERFSLSAIAATTFWSNIFFWMESGYFDTATELKPLLHTWSLAVEEQYYIFFPVLLAVFWRFGRRVVLGVLALIFVVSLALGVWDFGMISEREAAFYLLPTRAWELMVGSFVAFYMVRRAAHLPGPAVSGGLSVLGIALIVYSVVAYDDDTPFPSLYTLAPTLGTALIILFERKGTWSFRILANRVFIGIGLVSYSAYLWHQPLFAYARYLDIEHPSLWTMGLLSIATMALAWLSYKFVETPFRNRARFTRGRVFTMAGVVGAVICAAGYLGVSTEGLPDRYDPRHQAVFAQYNNPANYVRTRFNKVRGKDFDPEDPRTKLLIVGDSYGQDMVNAIAETALNERYQVRAFHISSGCGNLYLNPPHDEEIKQHIGKRYKPICDKRPRYEDPWVQATLPVADEVWLVSSWNVWHVPYLPETLANIRAKTDAKVRIIGRKNFGPGMSARMYWHNIQTGNTENRNTLWHGHNQVNKEMRAILPADVFIDISSLMCGTDVETCKDITDEGLLISYDGGHLTKAGATFMGQKMLEALK